MVLLVIWDKSFLKFLWSWRFFMIGLCQTGRWCNTGVFSPNFSHFRKEARLYGHILLIVARLDRLIFQIQGSLYLLIELINSFLYWFITLLNLSVLHLLVFFLQVTNLNFLVPHLPGRLPPWVSRIFVKFGLVQPLFASTFLTGFIMFVHLLHDKICKSFTHNAATISLRL